MRRFACGIVLAIAASVGCAGDPPKDTSCHGALYDPCNTEHDCSNGNCRPFADENITVCTQACDANTPCPPQFQFNTVPCNASGLCEPPVANSCKIQ